METINNNTNYSNPRTTGRRLASLDALRGFDMFWIIGGTLIFKGLGKVIESDLYHTFLDQFTHVPWEGFHFYDLIWPLFMFIMGVAIPFSVASRRDRGMPDNKIIMHAVRRAIIMFLLGTVTQGNLLKYDISVFRPFYSVLHGLAAGYLVAVIIYLKIKVKWHPVTIVIILLLYWGMMTLIPVPGFGAGILTPQGNVATWFDQLVMGRFHYGTNTWFMSYPVFGASVLLGAIAGQILISSNSVNRKILILVFAGLICLASGLIWSIWFPVIKLIWTSSFVLVGGGLSFLLLVLFYWIIDVKGYKKWAFFFIVIGMNSLAVYIGTQVINFRQIGNVFVGNLLPRLGLWDDFVSYSMAFIIVWLILYWMYRKDEFIRL